MNYKKYKIGQRELFFEDTKEMITVPDCFVVNSNKIGSGHGEAKLYVGQESNEIDSFFGRKGFVINCFLLKDDLIKYLEETKDEYNHPQQQYLGKIGMKDLWNQRKLKIDSLPQVIDFTVTNQKQIAGPRVYINSRDTGYNIMRELSLPNITYISIIKLFDKKTNIFYYYFRLFADYFGQPEHPYSLNKAERDIETSRINIDKKYQLRQSRIGQGKYRENLILQCPFCPITMMSDDRVLIASHIKPWSKSNNEEKIDPYNGFMFTPTYDFLFDRGFLSFTDDKRTILSPFLSNMTYKMLGISDNKLIGRLPIDGRLGYLEYHRENILKSI